MSNGHSAAPLPPNVQQDLQAVLTAQDALTRAVIQLESDFAGGAPTPPPPPPPPSPAPVQPQAQRR
jgi:hypothetical protein